MDITKAVVLLVPLLGLALRVRVGLGLRLALGTFGLRGLGRRRGRERRGRLGRGRLALERGQGPLEVEARLAVVRREGQRLEEGISCGLEGALLEGGDPGVVPGERRELWIRSADGGGAEGAQGLLAPAPLEAAGTPRPRSRGRRCRG